VYDEAKLGHAAIACWLGYRMLRLAPVQWLRIGSNRRRHPMPGTVPVTINVDPDIAAALDDPAIRARLERLVRRTLRPAGVEQLFAAMHALSDEARRRGLTDEILEAELNAHNAEGRNNLPAA
jgi:hypothetical protein